MRVFEETFMFRPMQADRYGAWKPSALMVAMQEMAVTHSGLLGFSRESLMERHQAVWVLTRSELEIFCHPKVGDMVKASTWPGSARRGLYTRYHMFWGQDGSLLARGIGGWVLADIHTRRMTDVPQVVEGMPDTQDIPRYINFPRPVQLVRQGEQRAVERQIQFSDIDQNQHVNNTRCADWACDLLGALLPGQDLLKRRYVSAFAANYRQEILPGGPVSLRLSLEADHFSMTCDRDGKRLLEAGGTLQKREV